jgi:hypothetical protein
MPQGKYICGLLLGSMNEGELLVGVVAVLSSGLLAEFNNMSHF